MNALARRLLAALVVAALGGILASSAQATPPALDYACSPAPADCQGWYRSPVKLAWDWNDIIASPTAGDCTERWFNGDTAGTAVFCQVSDDQTGDYTGRTVTIRVDKTPPAVTGATPDRPPDYGGWFNHPVSFSFQATDATSGVHSCGPASYGGPDGASVSVTGSCRDVAGNTATGSFPLNYDATPPPAPAVEATPGDGQVALRWSGSPGAEAEVVRMGADAAAAAVYRGPGAEFTDRSLQNEQRYRYVVTLIDQAGNRAASEASAVPTASKLLSPARRARLRRPPLLRWKRVRKARYYNVQLFRGGRKVLSRWPKVNRLQLRRTWRYAGRRRRLTPGRYCWYVWPGYGQRSQRDYGRLLGKKCFRVVR